MTEQKSITITGEDGKHVIIITPVNVAVPGGGFYATGQYRLTEGSVGIGTITVDDNLEWEYDGISDLDLTQLGTIANFIIEYDTPLLDTTDIDADNVEEASQAFGFTLIHKAEALNIQVLMHYPLYDVLIDGKRVAQLEQDHHSNWFVADGELDDSLVQQIGERIVNEIVG